MHDDSCLEINPYAIMAPQSRNDVAKCIEECLKELSDFAKSMAPPEHRIRSSEALFFNRAELLQETVYRLLRRGRVNPEYTFLAYAWWEMRRVRHNVLARLRRLNEGEES